MSSKPETPSAELVLAAIDRAIRQSSRLVNDVSANTIADHLALNRRSGVWRQARSVLRELEDADGIKQGRRSGIVVWALTDVGRERLARVIRAGKPPMLPPSPHRRLWEDSRRLAAQEADRYRAEMASVLNEGLELLADAMTDSDAWLRLSTRLARAAERVGAVVYCLTEWPEPGEGEPDRSEGPRMRSRARFGAPL
jgi:hypothetical protein